jgi:hypothetical protein
LKKSAMCSIRVTFRLNHSITLKMSGNSTNYAPDSSTLPLPA